MNKSLYAQMPNKQRGVILIVGMVLLMVMMITTLTGVRMTRLEERMVGNNVDVNVAFQAAETAIADGETFLRSAALPAFNGSNGLYIYSNSNLLTRLETSGSYHTVSLSLPGQVQLAQMPRYIIEQMPAGLGSAASSSLVLGGGYGGTSRILYRITAIGFGGSSNTRVVLQSTFMR